MSVASYRRIEGLRNRFIERSERGQNYSSQNTSQVNEVKIIAAIETSGLKSISCLDQTISKPNVMPCNDNSFSNSCITLSDDKTSSFVSQLKNISEDEISMFKALTQSILNVVKRYGSIEGKPYYIYFWGKVAHQMKSYGFNVSGDDCKIIQDKYVNDFYGMVFNLNCLQLSSH